MAKPKIHISVFERIANGTDGYAPGNIPYDCDVVTTKPDKSEKDWPSAETIHAIKDLLREGSSADPMISPLEENEKTVRSGQRSYRTFLIATFVVAFMSVFSFKGVPLNFSNGAVQWDVPLWLVLLIGLALVGSWVLLWSSRVDARLNSAYSRRWNKHRARLRELFRTDKRLSATQPGKERGAA